MRYNRDIRGYSRSNLLTVDITAEMLKEAQTEAEWLRAHKIGATTRAAKNDRDIIGSLAHQIVESKFDDLGLPYKSTRKEQYKRGDTLDIMYENDKIDVKGTEGEPNEKYFYNEQFYVFARQVDDPKFMQLSHLIFCKIAHDRSQGWIYGVMSVPDFIDGCVFVPAGTHGLRWDNQEVRAHQLKPFLSYVFRVPG